VRTGSTDHALQLGRPLAFSELRDSLDPAPSLGCQLELVMLIRLHKNIKIEGCQRTMLQAPVLALGRSTIATTREEGHCLGTK